MLESINKTKKKIILKAIYLYNQKGFFNVLNQEIAKESNISLSNLNYHFPTKKDLIISVCGYMSYTLNKRISENKLLINDAVILEMARIYLEFENEFKFFYLDTHNILKKYSLLDQEMEKPLLTIYLWNLLMRLKVLGQLLDVKKKFTEWLKQIEPLPIIGGDFL